jgi:hypothetical protein
MEELNFDIDAILDDIDNEINDENSEFTDFESTDFESVGSFDEDLEVSESATNLESITPVKESLHKIPGKHKLKWDSIFKGKKNDDKEEDENFTMYQSIDVKSSSTWFEDLNSGEEKLRLKALKEKIHELVVTKTKLNLKVSRRKPSRLDFNQYYSMLLNSLKDDSFTRSEIFVEFSGYFSDSIYNMFKLLDKKWRILIINDLTTKYKITDLDSLDFN